SPTPGPPFLGPRIPKPLQGSPILHSLHYLDVAVSEPSPGVPQFMSLGFMDGIPFTRYDSERGQVELLMQWMEDGAEPGYWESQTQIAVRNQHLDARNLETLQHRYNQSGGLHTSQWLYGCDLLDNGSVRGSSRYRYDGWDFISFKLRYKSFVTANNAAEITQRLWKEKGNVAGEWFRKYFRYGQKELERKVVPDVHVSRKEEHGTLILSCHVYGFYPNTTAVSWMKGSEIRDQKMEWGGIVPNSDGTFHTWARIEALPEEWEQYRCQVEHPGMLEPGIFTWGEAGNVGIEDLEFWNGDSRGIGRMDGLGSGRDSGSEQGSRAGSDGIVERDGCWILEQDQVGWNGAGLG
uniref:Ig-like domain-containing protein n=1 Tax=Cyanistes caeruleus TaxID=156563 RepID=A0A8C0UJ04_CYACU